MELTQVSLISGVQPVFQLDTRWNWWLFTEESRSTPSLTEGWGSWMGRRGGQRTARVERDAPQRLRTIF